MSSPNHQTPSDNHTALVVTSISSPNRVLRSLASGCRDKDIPFILVGDASSPSDFSLEGCDYYDLAAQAELSFETAKRCPTRHYARKNIGYLIAMQGGAEVIIETDDDNFPMDAFWDRRTATYNAHRVEAKGPVNVYRYFTEKHIWPRGLPLDSVHRLGPAVDDCPIESLDCPIQQGLANGNPDVDAIYRFTQPLPLHFENAAPVALAKGSWSPFNSQNTTWFKEAFPLLYLPATCSFRMTDIWRSFIAQRIAWANHWHVLFHHPTVFQERNEHNLMKDFEDEVSGYLNNGTIIQLLDQLTLKPGHNEIPENMFKCYELLVASGILDKAEIPLLIGWLADIFKLESIRSEAVACEN